MYLMDFAQLSFAFFGPYQLALSFWQLKGRLHRKFGKARFGRITSIGKVL